MNMNTTSLANKDQKNTKAILQSRLVDCIDLMQQAKQAHWNVRGMHFLALHELFDKLHESLEESADQIAERIMQQDGIAEGTCKFVATHSSLPEFPKGIRDGNELIIFMHESLLVFRKLLEQNLDSLAKWNDPITADLLTDISRGIDKNLWFLDSHLPLQKKSVASSVA